MWLALNAAYRGHLALAREHIRHAQALEPMSLSFAAIAGMMMYYARDFAGSGEHLAQLVRSVPDAPLPRHLYARVLLAQGAAAEALALVQGDTGFAPGSLSNLGRGYALCGRHAEARAEVERLRRLSAEGFGVGYDLCQIHIALDERDAALAALEHGVDDGSQMIGYLNCDAALDPIRNEPRFDAVARRLGLR
jgi:predicted Zn-dependent protease